MERGLMVTWEQQVQPWPWHRQLPPDTSTPLLTLLLSNSFSSLASGINFDDTCRPDSSCKFEFNWYVLHMQWSAMAFKKKCTFSISYHGYRYWKTAKFEFSFDDFYISLEFDASMCCFAVHRDVIEIHTQLAHAKLKASRQRIFSLKWKRGLNHYIWCWNWISQTQTQRLIDTDWIQKF